MPRICIVPRVAGIGGMASFRLKLETGLAARRIEVVTGLDSPADAVLVIGGTRDLAGLWRAKRRGVPIVHRLDGINWIHRRKPTPPRLFLRSEAANLLLAFIRAWFADRVIYQSEFVRRWWEDWYGRTRVPHSMIHNGVDLTVYNPHEPVDRPVDRNRILVVEGSLSDGQDVGLSWVVALGEILQDVHRLPVELTVAAKVAQVQQDYWKQRSRAPIDFLGPVARERIPSLDRSAHVLFSAELNPPCPNAVIEALASGLPVIGFDTGALAELVTPDAGSLVPYGGNPWRLDAPDVNSLARTGADVLADLPRFRAGARARAEKAFGLDLMVDKYVEVLLGGK